MEIIWVIAAFALELVANAVGLPPLLGYLGGGFTLFAFGVEGSELLGELAHYGVIFLLFALGPRIRLRHMVQPEVLGRSLLQFISVAVDLTPLEGPG